MHPFSFDLAVIRYEVKSYSPENRPPALNFNRVAKYQKLRIDLVWPNGVMVRHIMP